MKMMPIVEKAMEIFPGSFINHNNELILIPKFNVYFGLTDIQTDDDFLCKMCEWVSRDCCGAMRYQSERRLQQYYRANTRRFNEVCGTAFSVEDMETIYRYLGNRIDHEKTMRFVRSGFDLRILEGGR